MTLARFPEGWSGQALLLRMPRWWFRAGGTGRRYWRALIPAAMAACALVEGTAGCGAPSPRTVESRGVPPAALNLGVGVGPGRWVALPPGDAVASSGIEPDGSMRFDMNGFRLTEAPDGAIQCSAAALPGGAIQSLPLPARLGGGFLIWVPIMDRTALYRSATWTGTLTPLAQVEFSVREIAAGFDRVYLRAADTEEWVALDPWAGRVVDLGALPPAPGYQQLAFGDDWFGIASTPFRGSVVTYDAGASWHPLELPAVYRASVLNSGPERGAIVVSTADGPRVIDAQGGNRPGLSAGNSRWEISGSPMSTAPTSFAGTQGTGTSSTLSTSRRPLGRFPLRLAVLHGWPDSRNSAVVIRDGTLARLGLEDGHIIDLRPRAVTEVGDCHGIKLGEGFGFVCGQERGSTSVYAFAPPLSVRRVAHFGGLRAVSPSGNGTLVVRGGCSETSLGTPDLYCIRNRAGELSEIRVKGDIGAERVVGLNDGSQAVLVPPRTGAAGRLYRSAGHRVAGSVSLKLPEPKTALGRLLRQGLWLDGFEEGPDGSLEGWVAGSSQFVGVRVKKGGQVESGPINEGLERSIFSGKRALSSMAEGAARETRDHGFTWADVVVPDRLEFAASGAGEARYRGCSEVGCGIGNWVRVGWGRSGSTAKALEAELPVGAVFPATGGGRWSMRCEPTGKSVTVGQVHRSIGWGGARGAPSPTSGPRRPGQPPPHLSAEHIQGSGFGDFLGVPAPTLGVGDVGLDHAWDSWAPIHVYAWGPRNADWGKNGRWQVRTSDPYSLDRVAWSTAATRSPWNDVVVAAQSFGHNVYGAPSPNFTVSFDSAGNGGLLFINTSNAGSEVYLFEENRPIVKLQDGSGLGAVYAAGVVEISGTRYFGVDGERFRIFSIEGNHTRVIGEYPRLVDGPSLRVSLVRNARQDAMGIWVSSIKLRGSHTVWYVYPVDRTTGRLAPPLVLSPKQLGSFPPACVGETDGWLLEGAPPISPDIELLGDEVMGRPQEMRARMLAKRNGLCLEALVAEADRTVSGRKVPASSKVRPAGRTGAVQSTSLPVDLTLINAGHPGRRRGFRCYP